MSYRRFRTSFCLLLLAGCGAIPGCRDPEQEYWHYRLGEVRGAVDYISRDHHFSLFDEIQLRELLGEPDVKTGVEELKQLVSTGKVTPENVLEDLRRAYFLYMESESKPPGRRNSDEGEDKGFGLCEVWIYDESRHFDKPLYCPGMRSSFSATVFLIRDGKAVGTRAFSAWKFAAPLASGDSN